MKQAKDTAQKNTRNTMNSMNLVIGSDHAGFALKEQLKTYLQKKGYRVEDKGVFSVNPADYPSVGQTVAQQVAKKHERGILICGTGIGMSIVANKVKGIRAALCHDLKTAQASREHNDANVLCLGGRILDTETAQRITDVWLMTPFSSEERHHRRIKLIDSIEKEC